MKKIMVFFLLFAGVQLYVHAQVPGTYAGRAVEQRFVGYNQYGYPIYQSVWVDMVWVQEWYLDHWDQWGNKYWESQMKRVPRAQINGAPAISSSIGSNYIFANNQYVRGYYQYYRPLGVQNSSIRTFMVGTIVGTMVTAILLN
jgi:hypothetical protein